MTRRDGTPFLALILASFAFRLPALINASTVDSDAAIVGLQAAHILRGEWAWLLFGSGYQTSIDSVVAAGFFAVLGATPLALMLSTLIGHVVATSLAYATLARHLPRWTAAVTTLPLVFTPGPLHTYILGPPRQASITLVFLAIWVIDGVTQSRSPRARQFAGGVIASLACFADPYALLFLPPLLIFALVPPRRVFPTLTGALVGIVPLVLLLSSPRSVHGEATFTTSVVAHNAALMLHECLPWVLSTRAYVPSRDMGFVPWSAGAFRLVQILGATLLLVGMAFGAVEARRSLGGHSGIRRLGLLGALTAGLAGVAFLFSPMVMDLFSARYLAAVILMAPFALAPMANRLGALRLGGYLAPYLVSAAVAGWLGFGERVNGIRPVHLPGSGAEEEMRLEDLLRAKGVSHAVADYWVAYRLTFLYREAIEVVPIHAAEDRYAPYRQAFEHASTVAYVFDARRSREVFEKMMGELEASAEYGPVRETLAVGGLVAVVLERP